MKKRIIILSAIYAALLTSCAVDPLFVEERSAGTTTVTFTPEFNNSDGEAATKAFADKPQVENLYLAVFNEGGKALVEYVKAEPFTQAAENKTKYAYTATLKTSAKPRVIHFIANAPEELGYGSDVDAVGNLSYSFDTGSWTGEDAYWGYLKLDNGICGENDPGFSSLEAALSDVRLVRNFAKIKVEAVTGSNFKVTRFWISNFPDSSTAAPYNRNARRFETGYAAYTRVTAAMAAGYTGFCPATSGLVSLSGLDDTKLNDIACYPGSFAYTFEREKPTSDPLCIIVGGTSTLTGGSTETFYKIELRDNDGNYLPVLRNFSYEIKVNQVSKLGESTVEAALNSVASGAIDTDLSLQGLRDLSNGKSRIAVSETEKVLFDSQPFELLYSFIPNSADGIIVNNTLANWAAEGYPTEADVRNAHLSYVTFGFESGLSGNVIESHNIAAGDEIDGLRKVSMTPVPLSDIIKTEVVTVTGHVWNAELGKYETLQRKVNYQMRPRLNMTLTLTPDRIPNVIGTPLNLTIGIEDNLPQSLFTLEMKITSEQMTLTPSSKDLSIFSEVGADGKPAFFITKAITWEEYSSTPSVMDKDGIIRKHFDCPLKVNTSNFREVDPVFGQGDMVMVSNVSFNTASSLFIAGEDDGKSRFYNLHYDKEYLVSGSPAHIFFNMMNLPEDREITVKLKGLEPADGTLVPAGTGPDADGYTSYLMQVSKLDSESASVIPTTGAGEACFQLVDEDFKDSAITEIQVRTPGFSDLRFNYNNLDYVVAGRQAKVMFHMEYIPLDGKVTIHLKNAVPADGTTGDTPVDGYTPYQIPVSTNDVEFPVLISSASKAYFKLSADGYDDSAVAESDIQKLNFSNLKLINLVNTAADYVIGGKAARIDFTLDDMPSDNVITIRLTNLTLGSGSSGVSEVTDNGDGSYDLTVIEKHVILDVTPASVNGNASYELADTEFRTNSCSAVIGKLSFRNLKLVNLNTPESNYVIGGDPARISFSLEDMPTSAHETITLTLTNLTIPEGATMSGISSITGSGDVYQIVASAKDISIDVKPTAGQTSASYTLADDEFNEAELTKTVRTRSFGNLKFNIGTGTDGYLLKGDATSSISFNVEMLPKEGLTVTVWMYNASINGATPAGDPDEDGFTPYEVNVTSKNTVLGITVNDDIEEDGVMFMLEADGFEENLSDCLDVWTRYAINWSKVQIKADGNAVIQGGIKVYLEDSVAAKISTGASGYAIGTSIDAYYGEQEDNKYYFKFTKAGTGTVYESVAPVTLADLLGDDRIVVNCSPQ